MFDCAGDPAASVLSDGGYLRVLYTAEGHRRKGLGEAVVRVATKTAAGRGLDAHSNITPPNPASEGTYRKLGFKTAFQGVAIVFHAPSKEGLLCEPRCIYCIQ